MDSPNLLSFCFKNDIIPNTRVVKIHKNREGRTKAVVSQNEREMMTAHQ